MFLKTSGRYIGNVGLINLSKKHNHADISYYIDSLIECGITLLLGQDFKIQLLRSNLLELRVHRYKDVNIQVVHKETQEVQCSFDISFDSNNS